MQVQELHIALDIALQKVGSGQFDTFTVDEKDFALNIGQDRKIRELLSPTPGQDMGVFGTSEREQDYLLPLRVQALLPLYQTEDSTLVQGRMPGNLLELLSTDALVVKNATVPRGTIPARVTTVVEVKQVYAIPFVPVALPMYPVLSLVITTQQADGPITERVITTANTPLEAGVQDEKQFYQLLNFLLLEGARISIPIDYQQSGELFVRDALLVEVAENVSSVQLTYQNGNNEVPLVSYLRTTRTKLRIQPVKEAVTQWRVAREERAAADLHEHPFGKSASDSPLFTLRGGKVFVYKPANTDVASLRLQYYRTPVPISLALNQTSELSADAHQQVVDMAAFYLMLGIQQPTVQLKMQDTAQHP